jgi:hypothetical protein
VILLNYRTDPTIPLLNSIQGQPKDTLIGWCDFHSVKKESKLKMALFKLIGQYEKYIYWQRVDHK